MVKIQEYMRLLKEKEHLQDELESLKEHPDVQSGILLQAELDKTNEKTEEERPAIKQRPVKAYKNPFTGEVERTKAGPTKKMKAWQAEHGKATVEAWRINRFEGYTEQQVRDAFSRNGSSVAGLANELGVSLDLALSWARSLGLKKTPTDASQMPITGAQCQEAREQIGLSIEDFAAACKVGTATIKLFEKGTRQPKKATFQRIIRLFDRYGMIFQEDDATDIRDNGAMTGAKCRDARQRLGMTLNEFSAVSGVGTMTLRKFENGDKARKLTRKKILAAFWLRSITFDR